MRSGYLITLLIAVAVFFGYAYEIGSQVCPAPLSYRLGELDPQFNLSTSSALAAIASASQVWESATGEHLFTYDPKARFTVNFVYDNRQAFTDAEETSRAQLDQAKSTSDALNAQYASLTDQYHALQQEYDTLAASYKTDLAAYNLRVAKYNKTGGAPADVYAELQNTKSTLDDTRTKLNSMADQLNSLVTQINTLGAKGNDLIASYNQSVAAYNQKFGQTREFTQGTYRSDGRIDIYSFADPVELKLVLAHELGHALSLDHVSNPASIMYYLIGGQPNPLVPSSEDMTEFNVVCGHRGFRARMEEGVLSLISQIRAIV